MMRSMSHDYSDRNPELASLYPAASAARLDPTTALRTL